MPEAERGPLIDRRSPVYDWVRQVVEAVERRTRTLSAWNGEIYVETDPRVLGGAEADGSMTLTIADVIEPIRRIHSGVQLSDGDIEAARDALATIVHEAAHLSTRKGDPSLAGAHPPLDAPGEALDEGLTELWTRDNVDDVIQDMGLDQVEPGLLDAPVNNSYPAYTAATQGLIDSLARSTGTPSERLTEQIRRTDLSQRWSAIADLVIDRHLAGLMPAADRPVIREDLANRLRAEFARAQAIQEDPDADDVAKTQEGLHVGQRAANTLDLEVSRLQDGYRNRQRWAARSTEPAQAPDGQRNGRPAAPEVERLRRMVGGGAPAAQATRMDPVQAPRPSHRASTFSRRASRAR